MEDVVRQHLLPGLQTKFREPVSASHLRRPRISLTIT